MNPASTLIAKLIIEMVAQINAALSTSHAFVHNDAVSGFAIRRVVDLNLLVAIRIAVRLSSHEVMG